MRKAHAFQGVIVVDEREWSLEKMTWPEAKEALVKADCVIVPVGSTEQHAHHMCLGSDTLTTLEVVRRIVERCVPELRLVVSPAIHYGQSEHHMAFPGTVTLRPETFMELVYDMCASLARHGVKRVAVFNSHGGNTAPLNLALQFKFRKDYDVDVLLINWWTYFADVAQPTHADRVETSFFMYLLPGLLRGDRVLKPSREAPSVDMKELGWDARVSPLMLNMRERTDTGGLPPDPTTAFRELGERLVNMAVERVSYILRRTCKP